MPLNQLKKIALGVMPAICVAIYSVLFLYLNNVSEVNISDILYPLLLSLSFAVIAAGVCSILTKSLFKGGILGSVFFLICINFKYILEALRLISYNIRYWHVLPIILLFFGIIFYLIYRYINNDFAKQINQIIMLVCFILILLNLFININSIIMKIKLSNVESAPIDNAEIIEGQPNVYFILLDEYSNFNTLNKYYGNDNRDFYNFLIDRGFTVSENSQNELMNNLTMAITTNYLNLGYYVFDNSDFSYIMSMRVNPLLFKEFYMHGYLITFCSPNIAVQWDGSYGADTNNRNSAKTIGGQDFTQVFFSNNIFYPFTEQIDDSADREAWSAKFDFLLDNIADVNSSQFVYVHSMAGHSPYIFTSDGGVVPQSERENNIDRQYYLGQYKFATKKTMDVVDAILEHDSECIIILMSDHSMRNTLDSNGTYIVLPQDKVTIFNAVYFKGEDISEINNQSGVNTLRIIIDRLFGSNLGLVEVPV